MREVLLIGGGTGGPPLYFAARSLVRGPKAGLAPEQGPAPWQSHELEPDSKIPAGIRMRQTDCPGFPAGIRMKQTACPGFPAGAALKLTACLGFSAEPWYAEKFEAICDDVYVASETDGTAGFCGNVIELLDTIYPLAEWGRKQLYSEETAKPYPDLALACGPKPMLAAAAKWCGARDIPLRVSLEERMGCGYGACAGCTIDTKLLNDAAKPQNGPAVPDESGIVRKKVCVHGPVFWADEVVW